MPLPKNVVGILAGVVIALGIAVGVFALGIYADKPASSGPSPWDVMEEERSSALALVRTRVEPNALALNTIPAALAAGEWSTTTNIMDCPGGARCFEVDFDMASVNIVCKWLIRFDPKSRSLLGYEPLNNAAAHFFTERAQLSEPKAPKQTHNQVHYEDDGSVAGSAISLIKRDYTPKSPDLYASMQAQWVATTRQVLPGGRQLVTVRFSESKADAPSEWIVQISNGDHQNYRLVSVNSQVAVDFVRTH